MLHVTQLTHDPIITRDFHGFVTGNLEVPFPFIDTSRSDLENESAAEQSLVAIETILKKYPDEIAGIIIEPLQGAGGHRIALPRFFRELSELAHRYQTSLGFDEVQTAGGQCGTFWAIDQFDLPHPPQAVASAKKIGTGVVYMLYPMDDHGVLDSTWGGTLSDMVRFVQEIKIIRREKLIEQVPEKTIRLRAGLDSLVAKFPRDIFNPRGYGLYQGFSLHNPAAKSTLLDIALEKESLLLLGAGKNSIRLRPTLSVTMEEIDLLIEKLERVFRAL